MTDDDPHHLILRAVDCARQVAPTTAIAEALIDALNAEGEESEPGQRKRLARDILILADQPVEPDCHPAPEPGWDTYLVPAMVTTEVDAASKQDAKNVVEHALRMGLVSASVREDAHGIALQFTHHGSEFDVLITGIEPMTSSRVR